MNSTGTLYIECPAQEKKNAFDAGREISENEYIRMLREYSTTIGVGMPRNSGYDRYGSYEIYQDNNAVVNVNYSKSPARIYDISGIPCDINEIYKILRQGMGVLIIEIIEDNIDDIFETEFKFWKQESMNINNDNMIDKDDRIRFLPIKDLRFEIDNHLFSFNGCKIYCEYDRFKVALIIQEINEI